MHVMCTADMVILSFGTVLNMLTASSCIGGFFSHNFAYIHNSFVYRTFRGSYIALAKCYTQENRCRFDKMCVCVLACVCVPACTCIYVCVCTCVYVRVGQS